MRPSIPASLTLPCAGVVAIPDRDLTEADAARLWGQDRASLGDCRRRQSALAEAAGAVIGKGN